MDNLFDEITDDELLLYANDLQLDGNDEFFNYNIDKKDDSEDNELQHNIEECQTKHLLKTSEEQTLSQKMGQLLTTATDENESLIKHIKDEIGNIPNYLTKKNKIFKHMMFQALSTITTVQSNISDNMDELRKIAILMYKIMIIQTYQLLWTAYLKSGIGQLIIPSKTKLSYSTTLPIWPKDIKTMLPSKSIEEKTNENETYLNFVNNYLHELEHQLQQYQTQLNIETNKFQGYTLTIHKMVETFIEKKVQAFRMKIEHKVELIHYDYHIQTLKLDYNRLKPNPFQEQIMKELCHSKYEQETTEQEVNFLKQQINYYNLPSQSFECSSIGQNPLINSLQNTEIEQELFQQYREIAEQSRANIFALYLNTAEEQREEYEKKLEINQKKMWDAYHSTSENEKITARMLDLMHQRSMKISERINCIYKFKIQSFVSKSKS